MPELPEVETITRGLQTFIHHETIDDVIIRQDKLRWPITPDLKNRLIKQKVLSIKRMAKYILIDLHKGTLIIHLGMSGSLRMVTKAEAPKPHDHLDFIFSSHKMIRYNDPRRFGAILWTENAKTHPLLETLGVEPLSEAFTESYLQQKALKRKTAIKSFIMNSKIVTGIGNIYAAEALFLAQIHPLKPAGDLSIEQYRSLVTAIKKVLQEAINHGGTTLKDFINTEGKPGYFAQRLSVYGRAKKPCILCKTPLERLDFGQRTTVFCPFCQQCDVGR